jgi:hypothetical protein
MGRAGWWDDVAKAPKVHRNCWGEQKGPCLHVLSRGDFQQATTCTGRFAVACGRAKTLMCCSSGEADPSSASFCAAKRQRGTTRHCTLPQPPVDNPQPQLARTGIPACSQRHYQPPRGSPTALQPSIGVAAMVARIAAQIMQQRHFGFDRPQGRRPRTMTLQSRKPKPSPTLRGLAEPSGPTAPSTSSLAPWRLLNRWMRRRFERAACSN